MNFFKDFKVLWLSIWHPERDLSNFHLVEMIRDFEGTGADAKGSRGNDRALSALYDERTRRAKERMATIEKAKTTARPIVLDAEENMLIARKSGETSAQFETRIHRALEANFRKQIKDSVAPFVSDIELEKVKVKISPPAVDNLTEEGKEFLRIHGSK